MTATERFLEQFKAAAHVGRTNQRLARGGRAAKQRAESQGIIMPVATGEPRNISPDRGRGGKKQVKGERWG